MRKTIIAILLLVSFPMCIAQASSIQGTFLSMVNSYGLPLSKESFCANNLTGSIASYNNQVRIIPASVSKIYTFDFALATLGKDFRYATNVFSNGNTLYINGGGDPHFVIENLRSVIKEVSSDKHITISRFVFSPNFYFNWKSTPQTVISSMVATLKEDSGVPINPKFTVAYSKVQYTGAGTEYQFQSAPLSVLIKQINNYSTNIAADVLFVRAGGPTAFADYMKKTYGATSATIKFETGSGLPNNYTTCDLTLSVMKHLEATANNTGIGIENIMSIPRIDPGILHNTLTSLNTTAGIVAKSGYVNYHHNYAGIAYTSTGPIYFAVFGGFNKMTDGPKTKKFVENFIADFIGNYTQIPLVYTPHNNVASNTLITRLTQINA